MCRRERTLLDNRVESRKSTENTLLNRGREHRGARTACVTRLRPRAGPKVFQCNGLCLLVYGRVAAPVGQQNALFAQFGEGGLCFSSLRHESRPTLRIRCVTAAERRIVKQHLDPTDTHVQYSRCGGRLPDRVLGHVPRRSADCGPFPALVNSWTDARRRNDGTPALAGRRHWRDASGTQSLTVASLHTPRSTIHHESSRKLAHAPAIPHAIFLGPGRGRRGRRCPSSIRPTGPTPRARSRSA